MMRARHVASPSAFGDMGGLLTPSSKYYETRRVINHMTLLTLLVTIVIRNELECPCSFHSCV